MGKNEVGFEDDQSFVKTNNSCLENALSLGFKGGVVGAAVTGFAAQHQVGILGATQIFGQGLVKYILPGAVGGAVFASTTCLMDNIRGTGSPISNAFIGGLAAGAVVGAKSHNPWMGLRLGLVFGTVGAAIRCFAVGAVIRPHPGLELDHLNKTLYLSDIKHLAPKEP